MKPKRGSIVIVCHPFTEFEPDEGYLVLEPGFRLVVEFVGEHGEEVGWLYGFRQDADLHGWFPEWAVTSASGIALPAPAQPCDKSSAPEAAAPSTNKIYRNGTCLDAESTLKSAKTQAALPSHSALHAHHADPSIQAPSPPVQPCDKPSTPEAAAPNANKIDRNGKCLDTESTLKPAKSQAALPDHGALHTHPAGCGDDTSTCIQTPSPRAQPCDKRFAAEAAAPSTNKIHRNGTCLDTEPTFKPANSQEALPNHGALHTHTAGYGGDPSTSIQAPSPPATKKLQPYLPAAPSPATPATGDTPTSVSYHRPTAPAVEASGTRGLHMTPASTALRTESVPVEPEISITNTADQGVEISDEVLDGQELPLPGFGTYTPPRGLLEATKKGFFVAKNLPMADKRSELLELVLNKRVVVVDAATGSGKSTLVPLFLAEQCAELGRACRIVVTQPRRIAAKGLARRVSDQCGANLGKVVAGYRVGNDRKDSNASIVYVTAGHLLEALVHNPCHLETFSHIVLDEVHERFVQADFLAALLKLSLSRPETIGVRIVVMSATLQRTFSDFFRPLLLPSPVTSKAGALSLQGCTPFEVRDRVWDDIQKEWPQVFHCRHKAPSFAEHKRSRAKHLPVRRRSDQLTRLCKELAPFCARLLCQLRALSDGVKPCVSLVFLPGLDQMREIEEKLKEEVRKFMDYRHPEVFLMHSTLEEDTYRDALDPPEAGAWRVVLATNIAESSLTVPGVSSVVDFGLHRVSIYEDEARMSTLATEWCSHASMKQRRGRTGRTTDGWYIRLIPQDVLDELPDFDESGVEKAPLTRVVLEAAHLAKLIGAQPAPRAGLPVAILEGPVEEGVCGYYDGVAKGWRVMPEIGAGGMSVTMPEVTLQPKPLDARRVLGLLPTPPKEDRVVSALTELRELGALTDDDAPTALGTAFLKLPVDIGLGRLVVLGWVLGCSVDAIILAAALSLAPSCDALRTPFNTRSELDLNDLKLLQETVDLRKKFSEGSLSEPITLRNLCVDWLNHGGGDYGRAPRYVTWGRAVHERLWGQFTEKIAELCDSLLRLLPEDDVEAQHIRAVLSCLHGRGSTTRPMLPTFQPIRKLVALLTWALAPLGFVAIGQTPALYGSAGGYSDFAKAVRSNNGSAAGTLWWPKLQKDYHVPSILKTCGAPYHWRAMGADDECFVGLESSIQAETREKNTLHPAAEILCRICGPFHGKEINLRVGINWVQLRPPRNPCMLNWYMPRATGQGFVEVRVSWKSPAETVINVPQLQDKNSLCRPKRFLLASGGEFLSTGGRRSVVLRGTTVLPSVDGGRSALLWLLAAGQPREGRLVALMAPRTLRPGDFEVRAVRFWQRTLWLPHKRTLSSGDLYAVNRFRQNLLEMQVARPHRLAGTWKVEDTDTCCHILCIGTVSKDSRKELVAPKGRRLPTKEETLLEVVIGPTRLVFCSQEGGPTWHSEDNGQSFEEQEASTCLQWSDGSRWLRTGVVSHGVESEAPVLDSLCREVTADFRKAAEDLLLLTPSDDEDDGGERIRRWPGRLVPLAPAPSTTEATAASPSRGRGRKRRPTNITPLAPFDLLSAEMTLAKFSSSLRDSDLESVSSGDPDAVLEEESDPDDDIPVSVSQDGLDEEFMWRLSEKEDWTANESRNLTFVETAIALPRTAVCVDCEQSDRPFSKTQLARHPDERRCRICIAKSAITNTRNVSASVMPAPRVASATLPMPLAQTVNMCVPAIAVPTCSSCGVQLNKDNCTASQRQKAPSRRQCKNCLGATAQKAL